MNRTELFYEMIFKRKSFHIFKDIGQITFEELAGIEEVFQALKPLAYDIKVGMRIVPARLATLCGLRRVHAIRSLGSLRQRSMNYRFSDTRNPGKGESCQRTRLHIITGLISESFYCLWSCVWSIRRLLLSERWLWMSMMMSLRMY